MRIVRRKIGVPVKSAKMSDYWLLVMNENVANERWISIKPHAFGLWKPKYCTHFGIMIISNVCSSPLHHGRKSMYFRHNISANAYQRNGNAFALCAQHIAAKSLQAYMLMNAPMHSLRNKNIYIMNCVCITHTIGCIFDMLQTAVAGSLSTLSLSFPISLYLPNVQITNTIHRINNSSKPKCSTKLVC